MKKLLKFLSVIVLLLNIQSLSLVNAKEEKTEVIFWHVMSGDYEEMLNEQVKKFNETIGAEKGITVKAVQQEWPNTSNLMTAMSANDLENMPDVIQLSAEGVPVIRDYENTVVVEDLMNDKSSVKKEDLIRSIASAYTIDGKMMGMPYAISALLMYYNQDALEAAGYKEAPKTISELTEMVPKLTEVEGIENAVNVGMDLYKLENFVTIQGKDGVEFGTNLNGHDGEFKEFTAGKEGHLLTFLKEWEKLGKTGGIKTLAEAEVDEFSMGLNAITIMSSSRIMKVKEMAEGSIEWNVAPIPTVSKDDIGGANASGSGLYILDRKEDKVEAAWEFVQFMASPEVQVSWLENTGYVPVNAKVEALDEFKQAMEANPELKVPFDVLSNTPEKVVPSYIPNYEEVGTLISETLEKVSLGELGAEEANETLTKGIQEILDIFYQAQ